MMRKAETQSLAFAHFCSLGESGRTRCRLSTACWEQRDSSNSRDTWSRPYNLHVDSLSCFPVRGNAAAVSGMGGVGSVLPASVSIPATKRKEQVKSRGHGTQPSISEEWGVLGCSGIDLVCRKTLPSSSNRFAHQGPAQAPVSRLETRNRGTNTGFLEGPGHDDPLERVAQVWCLPVAACLPHVSLPAAVSPTHTRLDSESLLEQNFLILPVM